MMFEKRRQTQEGVMMAAVVILFTACTLLLTALLQLVTTTSAFTNEVVYRQIAQTAAKSALEWGKEQYDTNINFDLLDKDGNGVVDNDTNSNGIADTQEEKKLLENSTYRVTFQLTVKPGGTSTDGRSKAVTGTGRVYLPASSTTPRYTRILNGEVIRSDIVSNDPSDYSPLAWYDASCGPPSTEPGCNLPTVLKTGTANVAANPISLREENKATGAHCGGAPSTTSPSDNRLSMTKNGECGLTTEQRVGLLFNAGSGLVKGSSIVSSYIQFKADGLDNVDVALRIRGIKTSNHPAFTTANGSQMSPATNAYVDWSPATWPNSNQSGQKQRTPDLSPIIQEVIDQAGWSTANNIGLVIECVSGNCDGTRRALTTPITLNITYSGYSEALNTEQVLVWRDRSGNGFHLTALDSGSRPTRSTVSQSPGGAAVNGKPMIRFSTAQSAMNASVPASTGRKANSYTTFAVMSVKSGTDINNDGNGNILSMWGSGTSNNAIVPYWRHPTIPSSFNSHDSDVSNGMKGNFLCQGGSVSVNVVYERQCRSLTGLKNDNPHVVNTLNDAPWTIFSNRSELTSVESLFRNHGDNSGPQVYTFDILPMDAPYTIALGYNPKNNVKDAQFEVSELIIYDRTLSCPQMEAVEEYLAKKWRYDDTSLGGNSEYASTGCRENNIPTY